MDKPQELTAVQRQKLSRILDCIDDSDIGRLKLMLDVAETFDDWRRFGQAAAYIASWLKSVIITTAALLIALGALNVALKSGLQKWLSGG